MPTPAAEALQRLGRLSLREHSMQSVLQTVVDLAAEVMPGHPETSVSLLINDKPTTPVYSGKLALQLDETQYGRGYGPCLQAASAGELTEITDARTETRWRDYAERAVELGSLSSLSVPLPVSEGVHGGLNIYAREPAAFDEQSRSVAEHFAPYAAVVAGNMHDFRSALDLAANLEAALESRAVIDQAKGILMERHKVTADQAFQLLVATSMQTNRKLRHIAEDLVHTGEPLPG